ncbi:MAG TPA: AMP-dependent synthetase/ligase [Streptosporangiaceae bacterium]|nr:AMP-dependent synthetase/ligase [Streptosporangiaceae bacterium]
MTEQVLEQRAALEEAAAGKTICDALAAAADSWPELPAYSDRDGGPGSGWQTITWARTRELARELAAGFVELGLQPGDRVALMLPNRVEHVLADQAALQAGAVPVTFYPTLAPDQVGYIAADCDARIAVLEGAAELARWQPVLDQVPGLRHVIVRDPQACPAGAPYRSWADFAALGAARSAGLAAEVSARAAAVAPSDPATLLYTSGTTGMPKGVVVTHASVMYELAGVTASGTARPHTRWVSYLPLAHIAERMFTLYLAIYNGWHVHFCHSAATELVGTVAEVQPTAFFGVPRVWEKIQAGLQALLAAEADEGRRAATAAAMDAGLRYVRSCQYGQATTPELAAEFAVAEEQVLRPIRSLLGLAECEITVSAAAPLPPEVGAFFAGLGLRILDVYGMTETAGAFTANTLENFKLGTVGQPVPGHEVAIAADGEILTRGPLNTPGYVNLPEQTEALLDADGWLHTGDIGTLDDDGFLSVIDRKKELIITAGGENIAPAGIENLLVAHPLVGQALAYGDRRPYVVAVLTLDGDVAPAWARARGIEAGSLAELAGHPDVLAAVGEAVAAANTRLARVQQVKAWRLLPVEWTAESEELTPTLKLKRRVVHAKYADTIDALYAGG